MRLSWHCPRPVFLFTTFLLLGSFLGAAALAGCAGALSASSGTITVNLAGSQAEAQAIFAGLKVIADGRVATMPAAVQAKVSADLGYLSSAVAAFASMPNGSTSYASEAQAVIAAVRNTAAALPLPPATSLAITEGTTLLSALVAGLSTITVSPKPVAVVSAVPGRISPPIPIPVR